MKQRIKVLLWKIIASFLEPILHPVIYNRLAQIQLSLKYKETVQAQNKGLEFEQVGFNVFSSTYEDGILLYLFSLMGTTNKKCVDIGAGAVKGSDVVNLIINHGFTGLLIDGYPKNVQVLKAYLLNHPETKRNPPLLLSKMITAENVNNILSENGFSGKIDLLAIDIDGIDYWVWNAIDVVDPRVVVVEYQDILGPDRSWTVPYKADFSVRDYPQNDQSNNYCGASLRAFVKLGKRKGYHLVGCNKGGWNAFFVKEGECEKYLPEVSVESCFKYDCNRYGIEKRFPLVKDMEWHEV
jgi:hypothetical protein